MNGAYATLDAAFERYCKIPSSSVDAVTFPPSVIATCQPAKV